MADKQLAFRTSVSSFLGLARMNSPEWAYALVGSLGSMICGSFSAIFSYILSAVLSVYYALDPRYSSAETLTLAPDFI